MITVWGRPDSSAVARVMWTIGELGLPHRRIDVGGAFGGLEEPAYRAMNPAGRIPAVQLEDGRSLWESNTIIRYLAGRHPRAGLTPLDPVERAQAEAWMDWSGSFGGAVGAIRTAYKAEGATAQGCAPAIAKATPALAVLEHRLADGRAFVMGDTLTIAELALGVMAHRLMRCPKDLPMPPWPAIAGWHARLAQRPAFCAHVIAKVSAGPQPIGAPAK